jgi:large subunit ribosomal protein L9
MKVILTEDITELGRCGETIEVKSGYARNYLMPRNLAIPATRGNLRAELEKLSLTVELLTGEDDKVFGSVTSHTIAELIEKEGSEVDRRAIALEEPIKALGLYTIKIKLAKEVTASVKLQVIKKES